MIQWSVSGSRKNPVEMIKNVRERIWKRKRKRGKGVITINGSRNNPVVMRKEKCKGKETEEEEEEEKGRIIMAFT